MATTTDGMWQLNKTAWAGRGGGQRQGGARPSLEWQEARLAQVEWEPKTTCLKEQAAR